MIRADGSNCPRRTPWRAQVGSAWWELCQFSPNEMIASGQKFAARSEPRVAKGRCPYTWQMELIDQVTWCSKATRTRLAQKNAVSAPRHDPVSAYPSAAG